MQDTSFDHFTLSSDYSLDTSKYKFDHIDGFLKRDTIVTNATKSMHEMDDFDPKATSLKSDDIFFEQNNEEQVNHNTTTGPSNPVIAELKKEILCMIVTCLF